jgi:hypothetical protein
MLVRIIIISYFFVSLTTLPTYGQSVYQLLYAEGNIKQKDKQLELAKYYDEKTIVQLEGKKAIFYDTTLQEIATIRSNRQATMKELAVPVRIQAFKCCVSGFTSFLAHHKKPYPVLYPDVVLPLGDADERLFLPQELAYKFWDTKDNKFRMRIAPLATLKDGTKVIELHKIINFMQNIQTVNVLEPFFFYKYDSKTAAKTEPVLIKERSLEIIDAEQLKNQIAIWVNIVKKKFTKPNKNQKELMLTLLSDFVHEICGYPDEYNFKKWLKEYCQIEL